MEVTIEKFKTNVVVEQNQECDSLIFDFPEYYYNQKLNDPFRVAKVINIYSRKPYQTYFKRLIDIVCSSIIIAITFPLFVIIALIIKLESRGPVIFKQERLGLHGEKFQMYKFRSMTENAENELEKLKKYNETNSGMFKMKNDPRVTRFGRFIRKYSIDEFPQLINVLRGEMSLVGFRPPIERELKNYDNWHYVRFASLPGLTGAWQTSGRSNITNFDKVINLEYNYIKNWNLLLDFKILLKTIPIVLFGKDAT